MNDKERSAMQQALQALETDEQWGFVNKKVLERRLPAITALREALKVTEFNISNRKLAEQAKQAEIPEWVDVDDYEEQKQEPVAWLWVNERGGERLEWEPVQDISKWKSTPLYAAPVRTKDLTDDEKLALAKRFPAHLTFDAINAVIAADREKNK